MGEDFFRRVIDLELTGRSPGGRRQCRRGFQPRRASAAMQRADSRGACGFCAAPGGWLSTWSRTATSDGLRRMRNPAGEDARATRDVPLVSGRAVLRWSHPALCFSRSLRLPRRSALVPKNSTSGFHLLPRLLRQLRKTEPERLLQNLHGHRRAASSLRGVMASGPLTAEVLQEPPESTG